MSTVAQNLELNVKPDDSYGSVTFTKAYGAPSTYRQDGRGFIFSVSELMSGKSRDFMVEAQLPKIAKMLDQDNKTFRIATARALI